MGKHLNNGNNGLLKKANMFRKLQLSVEISNLIVFATKKSKVSKKNGTRE